MRKNKKLLLASVAAMGALALGVGATSTFAWFTASGAASAHLTTDDTKTFTVDYNDFSTTAGQVEVTLQFEEITSNKDLQLAAYGKLKTMTTGGAQTFHKPSEAGYADLTTVDGAEGYTVTQGWHQAYKTSGGTVVWNSVSAISSGSPYGVVAGGHAAAYYRVYRIKATWTATNDDKTATITDRYIHGNVAISDPDNDDCMIFWKKDGAAVDSTGVINDDGKTSTPDGDFNNTAKAFTLIDLGANTGWTVGANTAYSKTWIAVSCDGTAHVTNTDVTGTLSFNTVTVDNVNS